MTPEHFRTYAHKGREEPMIVVGPAESSLALLVVPPLFDEMNRMRRTLLLAMRALGLRGVTAALIDLPGTGESLAPIAGQTLADWAEAVRDAAAATGATHVMSLRGGALVDHLPALPRLRVAAAKGTGLVRTLMRARMAASKEAGRSETMDDLRAEAAAGTVELAGWRLGGAMVAALEMAEPAPGDGVVDLAIGSGGMAGSTLWLRAEPGEDPALAGALAGRTAEWMGA